MSCMDIMYQNGLSSCFPTPFTGSSYAGAMPAGTAYHYQPAAVAGGVTPASSSKTPAGESPVKKFGSARAYSDRHHPYSSSGNSSTSSSRLSDSHAGMSSSATTSNSMSATSTHSRVGLCTSDAGRSSSSGRTAGKEDDEKPPIVHYITPTTCLLIDYSGDAASSVDDHFNRALNPSLYVGKNPVPMKNRNLPASIYDPNMIPAPLPQQCHNTTYGLPYHGAYPSTSSDYYTDPYYPPSFHPATFQHPQADAWQCYAYNSVAAAQSQRAAQAMQMTAADFSAANRFNSSTYNSLISQGIFPTAPVMRSSRIQDVSAAYKTGSDWSAHSVFGTEMSHYPSPSEYDYSFSGKVQPGKDLHWH